ncbi:MAG: hypothetical protein JST47_00955 [Bacteroidetes bacterium]|nr:hypothetical protein [Bacteroidota bacterium]MBS1974916.1 hypothetical protein [Bacteroidota bacterium]
MKRIICFVIALSTIHLIAQAQDKSTYKAAIGLRVSDGYYDLASVSFKAFLGSPLALEANIGFRNYGIIGYSWFNLSGSLSLQYHFKINAVQGLQWFIGGGATAFNTFSGDSYYRGFGLGVFPTAGADYKFSKIPLDVSADIRPTIGIIKPYAYYDDFYLANVGVSARYTFK